MIVTPEVLEEMQHLFSIGKKDAEIAEKFGLSKSTVNIYRNGKQYSRRKAKETTVSHKTQKSEFMDYSLLPDNILFDHRKYPVF